MQDPKLYVNTILEVYRKYHALVISAFKSDSGFLTALDKVKGRCCLLIYFVSDWRHVSGMWKVHQCEQHNQQSW